LQLSGDAHTRNRKPHHPTSGNCRQVILRRSLAPRLLLTWTATLILAASPSVWFHFVSGDEAGSTPELTVMSKFRKLVLCVFVLSFVMPVATLLVVYIVLLRTWFCTAPTDR